MTTQITNKYEAAWVVKCLQRKGSGASDGVYCLGWCSDWIVM